MNVWTWHNLYLSADIRCFQTVIHWYYCWCEHSPEKHSQQESETSFYECCFHWNRSIHILSGDKRIRSIHVSADFFCSNNFSEVITISITVRFALFMWIFQANEYDLFRCCNFQSVWCLWAVGISAEDIKTSFSFSSILFYTVLIIDL